MTTQNWTLEQRLSALMRLPWSLRVERDDSDGSLTAQVAELPDAIATGATLKELGRDLWESLFTSLQIRLEHDDPIPLPAGSALPWTGKNPNRVEVIELQLVQPTGPVIVRPRAGAAA